MSGGFEVPETEWLVARVRPGTTAVDIGANVGMFTVPLAARAERVLALEPAPANVERLEDNLRRNALENVTVRPVAAGERAGKLVLRLGNDSMFHSTTGVGEGRSTGDALEVEATTVDAEWRGGGAPAVSGARGDVRGGGAPG